MSTAYLDTTVLAEVCLKKGHDAGRIRAILEDYAEKQVSCYVLKEFRAGVLSDVVFYYNKLVSEARGFEDVFAVLDKLDKGGFRRYRSKIAQQVSRSLAAGIPDDEPKWSLLGRLCDELSELILDAWDEVRTLGHVIEPIACYDGNGPVYNELWKLFEMPVCWPNPPHQGCCVALRARAGDAIDRTIKALKDETRREARKRIEALETTRRSLCITRHQCRHLGDFAVVLFAPEHAHVLSTNRSDFPRLCDVLGKSFRDPLS